VTDKRPWEYIPIDAGLIDEEQAWKAIDWMTDMSRRRMPLSLHYLPQTIVGLGFASKRRVLEAYSRAWGIPFEENVKDRLDPKFLGDPPFQRLLTLDEAKKNCWLPLRLADGRLLLACPAPTDNVLFVEDLRMRSGAEIEWVLALAGDIDAVLALADPGNQSPTKDMIGPGTDINSIIKKLIAEGRIEEAGEAKGDSRRRKARSYVEVLFESDPPVIARDQLVPVAKAAQELGVMPHEAAIRMKLTTKQAVLKALSEAWGDPFVDFDQEPPSLDTVRRLRGPQFVWESVLLFDERDGELCLAMKNPSNRLLIEHIEKLTGKKVRPYLALPEDILGVIRRLA